MTKIRVDSTTNHYGPSSRVSAESEGLNDDLNDVIAIVTTIAQSWCERATNYVDIETLISLLLIGQCTFAAHDSFVPYSRPYPMMKQVRACILKELNSWDETALHDHLLAHPPFRQDLEFESLPNQSTFWRAWNHRFSEELCDVIQECADSIVTATHAYEVSLPDRVETNEGDKIKMLAVKNTNTSPRKPTRCGSRSIRS